MYKCQQNKNKMQWIKMSQINNLKIYQISLFLSNMIKSNLLELSQTILSYCLHYNDQFAQGQSRHNQALYAWLLKDCCRLHTVVGPLLSGYNYVTNMDSCKYSFLSTNWQACTMPASKSWLDAIQFIINSCFPSCMLMQHGHFQLEKCSK